MNVTNEGDWLLEPYLFVEMGLPSDQDPLGVVTPLRDVPTKQVDDGFGFFANPAAFGFDMRVPIGIESWSDDTTDVDPSITVTLYWLPTDPANLGEPSLSVTAELLEAD